MDEDLARAHFEYLSARLSELSADIRRAEAAIGMRMTLENVRKAAMALAQMIKLSGNALLADRYRFAFENHDSAVLEFAEGCRHDDAKAMDIASDRSADAEEEFERVASEVMMWFDAIENKSR